MTKGPKKSKSLNLPPTLSEGWKQEGRSANSIDDSKKKKKKGEVNLRDKLVKQIEFTEVDKNWEDM